MYFKSQEGEFIHPEMLVGEFLIIFIVLKCRSDICAGIFYVVNSSAALHFAQNEK